MLRRRRLANPLVGHPPLVAEHGGETLGGEGADREADHDSAIDEHLPGRRVLLESQNPGGLTPLNVGQELGWNALREIAVHPDRSPPGPTRARTAAGDAPVRA